jgi:hypothetical protein
MNSLKKYLGILWMLLGPAAICFLIWQASQKLSKPTATSDEWVQWSIIIFIFTPIAIGMVVFGWYAWKKEYDTE